MNLTPEVVWFLVGLVLMILEFAAPEVVLVFFGAAAWIVALTTYLGLTGSLASQLIFFSISTVALLVGLRKWIRDKFVGHVSDIQDLDVDLDEFTGKSAVVLEDIEPGQPGGKVEFKGADWNARSDETIRKGETGIIAGMDGLTLIIKKS
jgi:membrane protein implicated in regulation of membrane protease activity